MPLHGDAVNRLQAAYQEQGAGVFSPKAGESLWNRAFPDRKTGQARRCASCHTTDLRQAGKHFRTGKRIAPMALSVEPKRVSDVRKIEKWFRRNCKWTLGRECTAQEKGDLLAFIRSQ